MFARLSSRVYPFDYGSGVGLCYRRLRQGLVVSSVFALSAYSPEVTTSEEDVGEATFVVVADVSGSAIATLTVEVTAPDITTPLVFNIPIVSGTASGTITVPAGSQRTITMRAFDDGGVATHGGSVTIDVQPVTSATLTLALYPQAGDAEIIITLGWTITIAPTAVTLGIGGTVSLTATVLDGNGDPVLNAVEWATLDASVATVASTGDQTGLVTGGGLGATMIVATLGATGGAATVVVE